MQPTLAIDSLLTAARYLEQAAAVTQSGTVHQTSPAFLLDPSVSEDMELRDLISGKMRLKRPSSNSSSASSEPYTISRKNSASKHSRTAHNELEKNRRANLRDCLETLKNLVPDMTDAARNTTLALLTRARDHIEEVEDLDASAARELAELELEQRALEDEFAQLNALDDIVEDEEPELEVEHDEELACTSDDNTAVMQQEEELHVDEASEASSDVVMESQPASPALSSTSMTSSAPSSSRASPFMIEYSPSSKPSPSPGPMIIDPVAEGLVPALPLCYPSRTLYPHFDLAQHASLLQDIVLPLRHLIA